MTESEQMNEPKKVNRLFLFLGIFSLLLTPFDIILEQDYHASALNMAGGGFFIFFSVKEWLRSKYRLSSQFINLILFVLVVGVIVAGLLKFLHKLQ